MSTVHRPLSTIFMGTPHFAAPALEALLRTQKREPALSGAPCENQQIFTGALKVVAAYSQPPRPAGRGMQLTPSPIHQIAEKHGIPVFTPVSLKSPEEQEKFRALNADVAVVVAYGLLLPQAILDGTRLGCINIHPSALPRWRGAAPIQRTIMAGDATTDICIMQMDAGLDTGPVLLRKTYDIAPGTTSGALHDQLSREASPLLMTALSQLADGTANPTPQSAEGITYAQKISKDEAELDFSQPASVVLQKILGLSPAPGAWFSHRGERVKIYNASLTSGPLALPCNPGTVYPTELQRAGGRRISAAEFMAGMKS